MVKMYGIPNCDVVKKSISWLNKNNVPFEFHDYKKQGITPAKLNQWCALKTWQTIFNTRSSTWKDLMMKKNLTVNNQAEAVLLMQEHTSIIKRPVIEVTGQIIVGYDENEYSQKLK
jgi:arsenate reductase (glutaredoxin)